MVLEIHFRCNGIYKTASASKHSFSCTSSNSDYIGSLTIPFIVKEDFF